ncbi:hypothetical protein ACET3X_006106 [Alternaria dauci]|uniref:Nuf2 DHR10-like domain-containing protein n=1 Tax=Alternaria dauci TaxID=48095 RepID=A0ABR3UI21_9PLEO
MSNIMTIADLKVHFAKSTTLLSSSNTSLKATSTSITKAEKMLPKIDAAIIKLDEDATKLQESQHNLKAAVQSPEMAATAAALEHALLKIRVLELRNKEMTEEKTRYQKKYNEAAIEAFRAKKENKSLAKIVDEQNVAIEDIRSEVAVYIKESEESIMRREASHEAYVEELEASHGAYAAELEELLEVQRTEKYAKADRIQCVASSLLWSN